MSDFLRKEFGRFIKKNYIKLANKSIIERDFGDYSFLPYAHWSEIWKDYYNKNYDVISEKFKLLHKNLDEKSVRFSEELFNRNVFIYPKKEYKHLIKIHNNLFFTEEDLKEQKTTLLDLKNQNSDVKFPFDDCYSVFRYDNGLKFFEGKVINYIKNKDFIDGGGFIGDSSLVFNRYNPNKIYSFEPISKNFEYMQKTIKDNKLEKTFPVKKGLGDNEKKITLKGEYSDFTSLDVNKTEKTEYEKIEITTIDEFVNKYNLNLGLIKLDVEGNELESIQGAIESIKMYRPVLIISIYHHPKDFFDIKPMIENLNLTYKFMIKKLDPFTPVHEYVLLGYPQI